MSTLVMPQRDDFFGNNDFHDSLNVETPESEDADSMDTTSPPSPCPALLDDEEVDENRETSTAETPEVSMEECIDQMIDEGLEEEPSIHTSDASQATLEKAPDQIASTDTKPTADLETSYGGIENLMNTCYMASALQMLASLESFTQTLREQTPREDSPLRTALLDLWDRLDRGDTVRPDELKRIIDERSCLFEGNEQQDAHEFLTTLLDLLDEDYKKGNETSETETDSLEPPSTPEKESTEDEGDMDVDEEDTPSSKRIKTCPLEEDHDETPTHDAQSTHTTGSFSELDVHQIEQLLHGSMPSSREGMIVPSPQNSMSCRLVGGRMNPTENSPFWSPHKTPTTVEPGTVQDNSRMEQQSGQSTAGQANGAPLVLNHELESKTAAKESPVDECFTTKVRVRLTCDSCKYTRTQDETYLHWSLEMAGDTSVDEVVRRFFAPERREVKCEKCFGESATQTSHITQLPKMLLLHFKRFVVKVSEDYSDISYEKNSSSVAFEPTISAKDEFDDYMAADCTVKQGARYHIRSVVNHHGSSVNFGHYTADASRTVSQEEQGREWHRFNDSFVTRIAEQQAVQDSFRSAYLVMYELE